MKTYHPQPAPAAPERRLAIRWNNCVSNDPCALCGARTDPQEGPELFLGDTYALVCYRCGAALDPTLLHQLYQMQHAGWN